MKTAIIAVISVLLFSSDLLSKNPVKPAKGDNVTSGISETKATMKYRGFSGGMMLHTGYVQSRAAAAIVSHGASHEIRPDGAPFGIGGAIKFLFGKHLRIGTEGYVSTLGYGKNDSRAETGWGGILADCVWAIGKWDIFMGGTVGGGSQTNITILSQIENDYIAEDCISYRKYGFAAIAPFFGAEYAVSPKANIVVKIDYLLNVSNPENDFVTGPRLYVGFMFGHTQN